MTQRLRLTVLEHRLAICRFASDAPIPPWATAGRWFSVTRTGAELSVACDERLVPDGVQASPGWRAIRFEGPFDLALTGVLASVAGPLAAAGVSIFAVATYDTDYVLVRDEALPTVREALTREGHRFVG